MHYRFSRKKQLICFVSGLVLCGLGVALSTVPGLGTGPISSLPYVLTFLSPLSLGITTILVNLIFIITQMIILRKNCVTLFFSQLATVCAFGFFIDLGMWIANFMLPTNYILKVLETAIGCAFLAAGIACQLVANISFVPGDGLVKAIANTWNFPVGVVKICFDSSLVLSSIIVSLIGTGQIHAVREGTVIAAFLVGYLIQLYRPTFRIVKKSLIKKVAIGNWMPRS